VPPANDDFASAKSVTAPFQDHVFTANADSEAGEKLPAQICGLDPGSGATIWYTFTPGANQRLTVDTAESKSHTGIAVYTGNAINTLVALPGACDAAGNGSPGAHVTFQAAMGTTYRIQIDSQFDNTVVTFAVAPTNDDFGGAKALGSLPTQDTAALRGASRETNEPAVDACGNIFAPQVTAWYSFTAAQTGSLMVSSNYGGAIKSTTTQPGISVYTGGALNTLGQLAGVCNSNPNNAQADFNVPVIAGTAYRVRISHYRNQVDPAAGTTTSFSLK
jgi:hypothetical protein